MIAFGCLQSIPVRLRLELRDRWQLGGLQELRVLELVAAVVVAAGV